MQQQQDVILPLTETSAATMNIAATSPAPAAVDPYDISSSESISSPESKISAAPSPAESKLHNLLLAPSAADYFPGVLTPRAAAAAASAAQAPAAAEPPAAAPVMMMSTPEKSAAEEKELDELEGLFSSGPPSARRSAPPPSAASASLPGRPADEPPSRAELAVMPVQLAVRALDQFCSHARIVDAVCDRWRGLSYGPQRRKAAADAGALAAIVKAMRLHVEAPSIQELCCLAMGNIVAGVDEEGVARKQQAADAGALEAVVTAMQAHVDEPPVQEYGCFAVRASRLSASRPLRSSPSRAIGMLPQRLTHAPSPHRLPVCTATPQAALTG